MYILKKIFKKNFGNNAIIETHLKKKRGLNLQKALKYIPKMKTFLKSFRVLRKKYYKKLKKKLKKNALQNIDFYISLNNYRGSRHAKKLPANNQRTKSNFSTVRKPRY